MLTGHTMWLIKVSRSVRLTGLFWQETQAELALACINLYYESIPFSCSVVLFEVGGWKVLSYQECLSSVNWSLFHTEIVNLSEHGQTILWQDLFMSVVKTMYVTFLNTLSVVNISFL